MTLFIQTWARNEDTNMLFHSNLFYLEDLVLLDLLKKKWSIENKPLPCTLGWLEWITLVLAQCKDFYKEEGIKKVEARRKRECQSKTIVATAQYLSQDLLENELL